MKYQSSPRSNSYQYLFNEVRVEMIQLQYAAEDQALYFNEEYNDEILDLKEKYRKRLWILMKKNLTKRQFAIVKLVAEGLTQKETATIIDSEQSNINKALFGNVCYSKGIVTAHYGGIRKRMRIVAANDKILLKIEAKLLELL